MALQDLSIDDMKLMLGHALARVDELERRCTIREEELERQVQDSEERMRQRYERELQGMQNRYMEAEQRMRNEQRSVLDQLQAQLQEAQSLQDKINGLRDQLERSLCTQLGPIQQEVNSLSMAMVGLVTGGDVGVDSIQMQSKDQFFLRSRASLAWAVSRMPNLRSVDLNNNNIGGYYSYGFFNATPEGPKAIAAALPLCGNLQSLSLDGNYIKAEGTAALAKGLPKSLVSLSLDNNRLCGVDNRGWGTYTIEGITALCEGIKQSGIRSLSLAGNDLRKEGAEIVANAIVNMPQLTHLNMANNNLTNGGRDLSGVEAIAAALLNTQISHLNVRGNEIRDNGKSALLAARPGLDLQL